MTKSIVLTTLFLFSLGLGACGAKSGGGSSSGGISKLALVLKKSTALNTMTSGNKTAGSAPPADKAHVRANLNKILPRGLYSKTRVACRSTTYAASHDLKVSLAVSTEAVATNSSGSAAMAPQRHKLNYHSTESSSELGDRNNTRASVPLPGYR